MDIDLVSKFGLEKAGLLVFYAQHKNEELSNRKVASLVGKSEFW